ncbi:proton-conducting transporter membrane subunit [Albimonas sp. CAU 1670]|uniref:hydrogen gas-evolving membrane-bound hydrogenase subunit E n=1 Tax=Albimonas sp. CAU 1670 TaxID=3032599 RepID=UPI0023DB1BE7|nr:hydrogen gas-evolving membrane-bound hydrogenase subunit E [Albimonas sp. CAU 1670]MDF2230931.1 proton-conducting transporter membrane subunit [Albimonas sp. CAU 1670]
MPPPPPSSPPASARAWSLSRNGWAGLAPVLLAAALFLAFLPALGPVSRGEALVWAASWVPGLGIELAFRLDGLSLTFALLITGIGALVLLYSDSYLAGHPHYARFALFLTAFMLSMLGLVLADDLIVLFVFWELTTLTSYLLIGFGHEAERSRRNALQALFVTGAGGLAMLAGLILLGAAAGTTRISEILAQGDAIRQSALYVPILVLVLAGALTKSAQIPFHFWLPNAMAAPTPVSAYLHSATMVKAGVYLMARLHPALSGTPGWIWTLTLLGAATAVFASLQSLRQTDLKQALAWTTLMALGTLTLLLGQSSTYALTAFGAFLVVHSLYKAALFLVVGNLDHQAGTRDLTRLGGLGRALPMTALAAGLAGLSMAGLPPFLGFIGKELKYAGGLASALPALTTGALLLANAMMVAVAAATALGPFWRPPAAGPAPRTATEAPPAMWIGPALLGLGGLVFGLAPELLETGLVAPATASLTGDIGATATLTLWHGINLPLGLSLATFALGLAIYLALPRGRAGLAAALDGLPNLDRGWDRFLHGLKRLAEIQTDAIQTGRLRFYLAASFATVVVALGSTLLARGLPPLAFDLSDANGVLATIALLLIGGAALAAASRSRLAAIAGLGVSGIALSLVFLLFGALDVAITQLLVETLVVVLVAVALLRLPKLKPLAFRPGAAALSAALGGLVTVLLLAVLHTPMDLRLSDWFGAASWPEAHGRNIVNVILVDFRAIDTFGEIVVVVIAAISAYALLKSPRGNSGDTR